MIHIWKLVQILFWFWFCVLPPSGDLRCYMSCSHCKDARNICNAAGCEHFVKTAGLSVSNSSTSWAPAPVSSWGKRKATQESSSWDLNLPAVRQQRSVWGLTCTRTHVVLWILNRMESIPRRPSSDKYKFLNIWDIISAVRPQFILSLIALPRGD